MDSHKICFIMCANDEFLAEESLLYINQLEIPEGFTVETKVIYGAGSMTGGYNRAMKESDAKFKVYLHQDVLLIHKKFIFDMIDLFTSYPQIGMFGVVGNERLASDSCPWSEEQPLRVGELYADYICAREHAVFFKIRGDYQLVMVLDGLLMATQYDLPWREDLFQGWHFYDNSQCMEFWKAGYQVAVPRMEEPWCLHDNDFPNYGDYELWRGVFEREYGMYYKNWSWKGMGNYTNNVLLIKGLSQYDAMRNYIDEIELGFRLAGYNTCILDGAEKSFPFQLKELLDSTSLDIVFECNAIYSSLIKSIFRNVCYVTYLTDHPAAHRQRLEELNDNSVVFVCDKRHETYIRQYCLNIKYVECIPLSGEPLKNFIPYNKRAGEIIFTGSYCIPEKQYDALMRANEKWSHVVQYMASGILENPEQDLEMCLTDCLSFFGIEVSSQQFHELMDKFMDIDAYARYFYRDKMIRSLVEHGLQVHVFGNGWETFEGKGKENLIIEKGNFYVARKAVANAKISINIMPWFKDGFQERIAAAMLSGTVSVTDKSKYIQENFADGKELVLYSLDNLDELPVKVKWLLEHPEKAEAIAKSGKQRAERELTWQHRTFEMIRYIRECRSMLAPQKGKYGEVIQIRYSELHNRQMALDAIKSINEMIDMLSQVKLYDKMELCDLEYFYTRFLMQYAKINANFPEITLSEIFYKIMDAISEEQVNDGTELLLLECMHMLAVFLSMENSELQKEKDALQLQIKQKNIRSN